MNMERFNFENPEEKIEKENVVGSIKSKGVEDPEVKDLIMKWTTQQENLADIDPTSRGRIVLNMDRADLYLAAGYTDGALETLEDAGMQALQENEEELYDSILRRINDIKGLAL